MNKSAGDPKDLASVTAYLSALASAMPTQRPAAVASAAAPAASEPAALKVVSAKEKAKLESEPVTQFSLSLRKDLRKQLTRLADEADMTMRAFVLHALKGGGKDSRQILATTLSTRRLPIRQGRGGF